MQIKQVFGYLENNLRPEKGGRVQFIEEPELKKEIFKIYIFDPLFYNYKYIFSFIREEIEKEAVFSCYVKSGFSGIDHKLEIPLTDEMYYDIKQGLKGLDGRFMKLLEDEVNTSPIPESYTEDTKELEESQISE